jgi:hypothetical protein
VWEAGNAQMDKEGLANRSYIIVKNKKDRPCLLIDVAIPSDRNVIQKETEKKLKYKNLSIEIL